MFAKRRVTWFVLLTLTLATVVAVGVWLFGRDGTRRLDTDSAAGPLHGTSRETAGPESDVAPSAASYERIGVTSPGLTSAERTTWGARVVARDGEGALADVRLRVLLLSPEAANEEVVLVSGADGEVGPIEIDPDHHPAADVQVEPGPQWAALSMTVHFAAGQPNHDVLVLGPPATLSVRVVDAASDQPVRAATVEVRDALRLVAEAACDGRGVAQIPWSAAGGPFSVRPRAEGYAAVSWGVLAGPPDADRKLELVMAPAGLLLVRVQDEVGRALGGCEVDARLMSQSLPPAGAEWRSTAARWGRPHEEFPVYRFSALPCEVFLVVEARTADGCVGKALVRIDASPRVAEVTLTVECDQGTSILVLDDRGEPLPGATVGIDPSAGGGSSVLGATDDAGRLAATFPGPWSEVELWAVKSGYALGWQRWAPEQRQIVLQLSLEGSVAGTVVDARGRPQRLVRVTALVGERGDARGERALRGERLLRHTGGPARGTDSSGTFTLHGLGGRWVDLHVRPPKTSPFHVRDVLVGTQDLVVTIPDEATLGRERGIALTVGVFDLATGTPVSGASVTAFHTPEGQATGMLRSAGGSTTKADGRVRLTFVEEGPYFVSVTADGYLQHKTPIVDYPVGEHAESVELRPACQLEVVLVGPSGGRIGGYWISAVDPNGAPVVFGHAEGGGYQSGNSIMTDVQGVARANRMEAGRLTLEVRDGYGPDSNVVARGQVELTLGERTKLELSVP